MMTLRLVVIVALLAGCTRIIDVSGTEWRRANASLYQVTLDEVECARDTVNAGDLPDTIVGGVVDALFAELAVAPDAEGSQGLQHIAQGFTRLNQRRPEAEGDGAFGKAHDLGTRVVRHAVSDVGPHLVAFGILARRMQRLPRLHVKARPNVEADVQDAFNRQMQ